MESLATPLSDASSSGSSIAATWPPRAISLQCVTTEAHSAEAATMPSARWPGTVSFWSPWTTGALVARVRAPVPQRIVKDAATSGTTGRSGE